MIPATSTFLSRIHSFFFSLCVPPKTRPGIIWVGNKLTVSILSRLKQMSARMKLIQGKTNSGARMYRHRV